MEDTPKADKGVEMLPLQQCQGSVWEELKEISQEFRVEMSKKAATYAETVQKDDARVLRVLRNVTNTENAPAEPGYTPRKAHPLQPPKLAPPAKKKDARVQSQSARSAKSACSKATAKTPKAPRAPEKKSEDAKHEIKRPKGAPPKNASTPAPKKDAKVLEGPTSPVPPPPVGILSLQAEEGREEAAAPEPAPTEKKGKRSTKKSEKTADTSPAQPAAAQIPEPVAMEKKPEEEAPAATPPPEAAVRKSGSPSPPKDKKRKRTLSNKAKAKKEAAAAEDGDTVMAGTEEAKVDTAPLPKDDAETWLLQPDATLAAPTTEPAPAPEAAPPVKVDKKSKGTQGKKTEAESQAASPEKKKKRTLLQSKKGGAEKASSGSGAQPAAEEGGAKKSRSQSNKGAAGKPDQQVESKAEESKAEESKAKEGQPESEKQVSAGGVEAPSTPQAPAGKAASSQDKGAKERKRSLPAKKAVADDAETWLLKPDATPVVTATPQPLEGFPGLPSVTPIENPRQFLQIIQPSSATAAQDPAAAPDATSAGNVKTDEPTAAPEEKTVEKAEEKAPEKVEEKGAEQAEEEPAEKAKNIEAEDKVPPKAKTPEQKEAEARRLNFDSEGAKTESKDAEAPEPKEPPKFPLKTPKKKEIALPKLKTPGAAAKTPKAAAAVKRGAVSESESAKRARHLALFAPGTRARTAMVKEWLGKLSGAQPEPLGLRGDYAIPPGNDLIRDLEQRRLAADLMRAQAKLKRQKKQLVKMAK